MTFNIKNSKDSLDRQTINHWDNRRKKIVSILQKYRPSIVGFQEVLHDQYSYLIKYLKNIYSWYGVGRDDGKEMGEYNPIFIRKDEFSIEKRGIFWLSDTPHYPSKTWEGCCYRICTWVQIDRQNSSLLVANTHFDEVYTETRMKSIPVLKTNLPQEYPLILMGDFNFTRKDREYKELIENLHVKDCFLEGYQKDNIERLNTYHGYSGEIYSSPNRFIDYIFSSDEFKISSAEVVNFNQGGHEDAFPSDHWPVLVHFLLSS
jgi:endonuclease/exonuclease/phosphatase family metal-dependent hydrolase